MRDLPYDETLLPPLPDGLGDRDVVCGFCRVVFERPLTGRPPTYCSKRCRQAEHRERTLGAGYGHGSSPRRRRVEARVEAELERAGELPGVAYFRARARALEAAQHAWPLEAFDAVWRRRLAAR